MTKGEFWELQCKAKLPQGQKHYVMMHPHTLKEITCWDYRVTSEGNTFSSIFSLEVIRCDSMPEGEAFFGWAPYAGGT